MKTTLALLLLAVAITCSGQLATNVLYATNYHNLYPQVFWLTDTNQRSYQLEDTTNLATAQWQPVVAIQGKTNAMRVMYSMGTLATVASKPQRYFRLVVVPVP